jgi:DNA-binding NarL/FixJ family response regulator
MATPRNSSLQQVLILKADRFYAEVLRHQAERVLSGAQVVVVTSVPAAERALATRPVDLFVTSLGEALEGDALDLIFRCTKPPALAHRILVVISRREYRTVAALRSLPINGVFDPAEEPPAAFTRAVQAVAAGTHFWSASIVRYLQTLVSAPTALFRILTDFEQVVLSVIGDGCDDSVAARRLGLSRSTIATVRRELHRKLRVQHRGELVRVAAQQGFVRFTPNGVERPGFALLAAAYHPRRHRQAVWTQGSLNAA